MKTLINGESINVLILVMCQFSPIYLFRVIAIEIPTDICIELDKLIHKFIRKSDQESWNEGNFKKKRIVGFDLLNIKSYLKMTVTKAVWCWSKHRHTGRHPHTSAYVYAQCKCMYMPCKEIPDIVNAYTWKVKLFSLK